jgi:N-acetyl-gamma-glutamylphosphate reductase
MEKVSVGIVGASGYGGVQLVRLLADHPAVELTYLGEIVVRVNPIRISIPTSPIRSI